MRFIVDENVLKDILNYLASKPYVEVFQMIQNLQKVEPAVEEVKEKQDGK